MTPNEINDRYKFFLGRGLDERNALGHALAEVDKLDDLRNFADRNVINYRPSWNGAKLRRAICDGLCF